MMVSVRGPNGLCTRLDCVWWMAARSRTDRKSTVLSCRGQGTCISVCMHVRVCVRSNHIFTIWILFLNEDKFKHAVPVFIRIYCRSSLIVQTETEAPYESQSIPKYCKTISINSGNLVTWSADRPLVCADWLNWSCLRRSFCNYWLIRRYKRCLLSLMSFLHTFNHCILPEKALNTLTLFCE